MVVKNERSIEDKNDDSDCRITACVIVSPFVAVCRSFSFGVSIGYTSGAEVGMMKELNLSIAQVGYQTAENLSLINSDYFGPTFQELHNKLWKLDCPNKIKHFIWQTLSGCTAVKQNLIKKGINCDPRCSRCGADNESINHALFECPPAIQAWALAHIPFMPTNFPGELIWYNLDFLFWRIPNREDHKIFPWIIWHIWKARNEHCFSNQNIDPREIVAKAEEDQKEWSTARLSRSKFWVQSGRNFGTKMSAWGIPSTDHSFTGYKCLVDASWKNTDQKTGLGWFCFPDSVEGMHMGARRVPRSLSALHSELEAVLWAMESLLALQITEVEISTDSETVMKIVTNPEEWPAFIPYQEDFSRLRSSFSVFSMSFIPRLLNHRADSLARFVRKTAYGRSGVNVDTAILGKFAYASSIFRKAGFPVAIRTKMLGLFVIPKAIVGVILVDKWGRRPLLLTSVSGMSITSILIRIAFTLQQLLPELTPLYIGIYEIGLGGLPWVIMSKMFPINIKVTAGSIVTLAAWTSGSVVTYGFIFLFEWSTQGTFYVFGALGGATLLFIWFLVPETKGLSLEEIKASLIHQPNEMNQT